MLTIAAFRVHSALTYFADYTRLSSATNPLFDAGWRVPFVTIETEAAIDRKRPFVFVGVIMYPPVKTVNLSLPASQWYQASIT